MFTGIIRLLSCVSSGKRFSSIIGYSSFRNSPRLSMKRARGGCFSGAGKSSIFELYNLRKKRVFEGVLSTNVERGNKAKRHRGSKALWQQEGASPLLPLCRNALLPQ